MKQVFILILMGSAVALSACATISEDDCQIGAWSEYGYKDGLKGRSSDRIASYAKKCAKYGIQPDAAAYLTSYDEGIARYCTYERGFERGEQGDSYNQACSGPLSVDFAPGYDAGRVLYEVRQEYNNLIERYEDRVNAIYEVRRKLREDELTDIERNRLSKKERRLEREIDDAKIDIRAFERIHDFSRYRF